MIKTILRLTLVAVTCECVSVTRPVLADPYVPPLSEQVRDASFIGVVTVVSVQPRAPRPDIDSPSVLQFRSAAIVRVDRIVKTTLWEPLPEIPFDNGFICPNVSYESGATYIVFLAPDVVGELYTLGWDFGRFSVDEGHVRNWRDPSLGVNPTLGAVLNQLETLVGVGSGTSNTPLDPTARPGTTVARPTLVPGRSASQRHR